MPPAGKGTTIVTGRLGQACEEAADGDNNNTVAAARVAMQIRDMNGKPLFEMSCVQILAVSGVTGACGLPCAGFGLPAARRTALRTVSGSARSTPSTEPPLTVTRSM